MPTKLLRCTGCKTRFDRSTMRKHPVGWFHSDECAYTYARTAQDRAQRRVERKAKALAVEQGKALRRQNRAEKNNMKSKSEHTRETQAVFNRYIRLRDEAAGLPCISCGRHHKGQYHAGHYRTTAACPELRFDEFNCHRQCMPCNTHLSGNILEYRRALILKVGQEEVDWIEGSHVPARYTIDDLDEIKKKYRKKAREFES